ncbi:MAG: hypothetical protein COV07_02365 [Candidatus Vogelbacteria bacterium CG10_big_fil_rev_8_21_14_0_10_45_14]|uniref:ATP-citrate synthase/succinyl-CoA ligase C-terminal domain-containing protein n=1 Tax=Candidatus Vogelbacteria bacterium CG10_big_fil_rev_8_21_14_0_10_45_14 TaxID=1975042 RepID=A0A2H0RJR3_9BACT|nr:MAG: hypothetical protein COV07_02365 [Candidatus Vogelbacteria bacterium CG10_big_fil_rev_8_21_14_0_10_45_14]
MNISSYNKEKWQKFREADIAIVFLGSHAGIIQSILDFDYLCGKSAPSVLGIVSVGRRHEKYFFGGSEVLIPCQKSIGELPDDLKEKTLFALNVQSGRKATVSTREFLERFPNALGAHIFAEGVPEQEAIALWRDFGRDKILVGPSGVGLLYAGKLKLGAIGGTDPKQLLRSGVFASGNTAVISASGGMTNEIITMLGKCGRRAGLAFALGGDLYPLTPPADAFLAAEDDPSISHIVYFGELGGLDEYEIATLMKEGRIKKPVLAYIAGVVDDAFGGHAQFGHAKALAETADESAKAKQDVLREGGAIVSRTFNEFVSSFDVIPKGEEAVPKGDPARLSGRSRTLFTAREILDPFDSSDQASTDDSLVLLILSALLGRQVRSSILPRFTRTVFELLLDHGPQVSGAVNTMITARAGKDLVDSLCAGLLTIGPRFGGAMNTSAKTWWDGMRSGKSARDIVDDYNKAGVLIPGIGHKKYRLGYPDPRIALLEVFVLELSVHPMWDLAQEIAKVTTEKRGNLILNIDGAVAALLLDILREEEGYTDADIEELLAMEFFNTFFIIPRSIGFLAHALEQKRRDEGLFRLPDNMVHIDRT